MVVPVETIVNVACSADVVPRWVGVASKNVDRSPFRARHTLDIRIYWSITKPQRFLLSLCVVRSRRDRNDALSVKFLRVRSAFATTSLRRDSLRLAVTRVASQAMDPACLPSRSSPQASEGWLLGLDSNQQPSG